MTFTTQAYQERDHKRFWWWRMKDANHDPLLYHLLDNDERELLSAWYEDTEARRFIGECAPPLVSMLIGFLGGNAVTRVVQLGHYAGYSTLHIGLLMKKLNCGHLCSIDKSQEMTEYTKSWVDRAGLANRVKLVCADSASAAAARDAEQYLGGAPDVVVIDSAHTYKHTISELNQWMPRLRRNGFVFLHDASNAARQYDPESGAVAGALEDWCSENGYAYFVFNGGGATPARSHEELVYRDGRGLGVIQKCRTTVRT